MKITIKRCLASLLALSMVVLSACGSKPVGNQSGSSTPTTQVAMGRYLEEEIAFPQEAAYIVQIGKLSDGSLRMLASKTPNRIMGPWYLYSSADGGESWTELPAPALKVLDGATISGADFTPDGGMVLGYVIYTDEMMAAMQAAIDAEDFDTAMALQPKFQFMAIDAAGTASELPVAVPDSDSGERGSLRDLRVTQNGDIILNDFYSLYQMDSVTGKEKNRIITGEQPNVFLPCGDQLAVLDSGELQLFDLATGEKVESVPLPGGTSDGSLSWDGTAIYYAGATGIYRKVAGGSVLEQVVDGALTSLNMPALSCNNIFPTSDKGFWGLFSSAAGYSALRYRYSEEVPTLPETQLRVYSLRDNENIRQAMGLYQRNHPDTQVVFDVGLPKDSSLSISDALRTLSTQLLAGQGPDVLVLDGLPVDSYIEKQVLAPFEDNMTTGLLPNIVKASREADGKLYALPARFLVPMLLTDSAAADSMTDLRALADYQAKRTKELPKVPPTVGNPMHPVPSQLINNFYPVSAPAWVNADGTVNTAAITEFLQSIKTITDATDRAEWENAPVATAVDGSGYPLAMGAAYWLFGHIPMVYGHAGSFSDIAPGEASITRKADGKLVPLPGQVAGSFIPQTMLGIGAGTKYPEAAHEFVSLVLSPQVQSCEFSGFAVNQTSFDQSAVSPYPPEDDGMTYGTLEADGSYNYLQVKWPDEAYMAQMKTMMQSLERAVPVDYTALQMVLDETAAYFLDQKSLEDTVTALSEKLKLYFAE